MPQFFMSLEQYREYHEAPATQWDIDSERFASTIDDMRFESAMDDYAAEQAMDDYAAEQAEANSDDDSVDYTEEGFWNDYEVGVFVPPF